MRQAQCTHLSFIRLVSADLKRVLPEDHNKPFGNRSVVCEDCMKEPNPLWVHLRQCLICGHIGCCNSSPKKHATRHFIEHGHMLIKSIEPNEDWGFCYIDELTLMLPLTLIQTARAASGYGEDL